MRVFGIENPRDYENLWSIREEVSAIGEAAEEPEAVEQKDWQGEGIEVDFVAALQEVLNTIPS
jgi:hypothetical protein